MSQSQQQAWAGIAAQEAALTPLPPLQHLLQPTKHHAEDLQLVGFVVNQELRAQMNRLHVGARGCEKQEWGECEKNLTHVEVGRCPLPLALTQTHKLRLVCTGRAE